MSSPGPGSLPVLNDVVDVAGPGGDVCLAAEQSTISALTEELELLWQRAALPQTSEDAVAPPAEAVEPSLAHKPTTRSRLLRMKEKGLFKNG
jgi:hypothetical protein